MQEPYLDNQTRFAQEEPLHLSSRKKIEYQSSDETVKKPPVLIFAGSFIALFLVAVFWILTVMRQRPSEGIAQTPTPTVTPEVKTASQIEQMVNELRSSLIEADPAKTALPFPPVADQIKISDK